jgi:hypothetical protein
LPGFSSKINEQAMAGVLGGEAGLTNLMNIN